MFFLVYHDEQCEHQGMCDYMSNIINNTNITTSTTTLKTYNFAKQELVCGHLWLAMWSVLMGPSHDHISGYKWHVKRRGGSRNSQTLRCYVCDVCVNLHQPCMTHDPYVLWFNQILSPVPRHTALKICLAGLRNMRTDLKPWRREQKHRCLVWDGRWWVLQRISTIQQLVTIAIS